MGAYYQRLDQGHFDYLLQTLPNLPDCRFRGPKFDPTKPFFACIGAAQTFGRFCDRPYPTLLAEKLGIQVLNLGVGGVGPRFFDRTPFLDLLNSARFVVVQVMSARSEGNSLFDNATGRAFGINKRIGTRMRFEKFLSDLVENEPASVVRGIVGETRENYLTSHQKLLERMHRPKVLLWFSQRSPDYKIDWLSSSGILNEFPHLVDGMMWERIRSYADRTVECVSTRGLPQPLWFADKPIDGGRLREGLLVNVHYPSPEMHREAAEALMPVCHNLLA